MATAAAADTTAPSHGSQLLNAWEKKKKKVSDSFETFLGKTFEGNNNV